MNKQKISRRKFIVFLSGIFVSSNFFIYGCGGDNGGGSRTGGGTTNSNNNENTNNNAGKVWTMNNPHSHNAGLSSEQLDSTKDLEINIKGNSDHPHIIQLTVKQLTDIKAGERVSTISSKDGGDRHSHNVTYN